MQDDSRTALAAFARLLVRRSASGALATLDENGAPFSSYVSVATHPDGSPILLLSDLAVHTRNLDRDQRASLLVVDQVPDVDDPVAVGRVTLSGRIGGKDDDPLVRRRFLARHGDAAGYADFGDFGFRRLTLERAHLVAGFGRIVGFAPDEMIPDEDWRDLAEAEPSLLDWLNGEQSAALHAKLGADSTARPWRATGVDPHGVDLRRGAASERMEFAAPVTEPDAARTALAGLLQGQA